MDPRNEFKNETDYNILLFSSDRLFSHKKLYKYMPKLVDLLQDITQKYTARESIENELKKLYDYIIQSVEPEISFVKLLIPGDYAMLPKYSYAYAISIIPYDRMINPRISVAIDITENKFNAESVDMIDKRGITRLTESIKHSRNPELVNRAYVTGQDDMRTVSVWKLTRHPFSYVVLDPKSTVNAVWGQTTSVVPYWCLVFIILVIILAGILFFGLYYITQYSELLSDRELNRLI